MFNRQATADNQQQDFRSFGRGCGSHSGKKFGGRFGGHFDGKAPWMKAFGGWGNRKSANIEENDDTFIISLYAAGLSKSDFTLSVTNDVLTISYKAPEASEGDQNKYTHQEYQPSSFERSFQLNEKVLTDRISATYTDGVLKVTLPKNPDNNQPAQQIKVD